MLRTTLACMENFFQCRRLLHISRMTRNPMPPKKISPQVTRFSSTSSR